jgi:competence protein ComEC
MLFFQLSLFFTIFIFSHPLQQDSGEKVIVWNVGQGSWTTLIKSDLCLHVDMGGTLYPKGVFAFCAQKQNILFITHFDWDHINFIQQSKKIFPTLCLQSHKPKELSYRKRKLLEDVPSCQMRAPDLQQIHQSLFIEQNESSIYILAKKILITGDAPEKLENKILQNSGLKDVQVFLLGHHGSKTSSGENLLRSLPHLKMTIASCLKKKYGHPHPLIVQRLKSHHTPLLITEEYGSIAILF